MEAAAEIARQQEILATETAKYLEAQARMQEASNVINVKQARISALRIEKE